MMAQPSKTTKLTKTEVDTLIKKYQENQDEDAQLTLVQTYKNLVETLAKKYSKGKSFHEDLCQVGMLGLLGAIKRYDPDVGKSFEAFAIPTIMEKSNGFSEIRPGASTFREGSRSSGRESKWRWII